MKNLSACQISLCHSSEAGSAVPSSILYADKNSTNVKFQEMPEWMATQHKHIQYNHCIGAKQAVFRHCCDLDTRLNYKHINRLAT